MNKINKALIGARNDDLAAKIREAQFLEDLGNKGQTPEEVISGVKETLGLKSGQSVIVEFEEKTKAINLLQKNFIDVNSLTQRLIDDNLIKDLEIQLMNKVEYRIAEKLMSIYDLSLEDLYLGEE